jgi:ribonuclease R
MMQAQYGTENVGHFGLSFPAYAHFTSPIRRYPDLMVHRALKHLIADGKADDFDYSQHEMANLGEHCSMTERRADEATRDASDALKCEFMLDKVGQTFEGRVVSVTGFGLFVELADIYITGLVHITALDKDFFHFDPVHHKLSGERSGKVYRLTDTVEVKVAAVNLDDRKIDLVLANVEPGEPRPPRERKGKGRGRDRGRGKGRDRRDGRRDKPVQRIEVPDDEPFEHPATVEEPPEQVEPKAKEKAPRERGKAPAEERPPKSKRRKPGRRERPALLAAPEGDVPSSEQKPAAERPAKKRRKGHPSRRRSGERPALLAPAESGDAPAGESSSRKPKSRSKDSRGNAKAGRERQPDADQAVSRPEVDAESIGNRKVEPPSSPPEVDGNRIDYVPPEQRKKKSHSKKKPTAGGGRRRRKPAPGYK